MVCLFSLVRNSYCRSKNIFAHAKRNRLHSAVVGSGAQSICSKRSTIFFISGVRPCRPTQVPRAFSLWVSEIIVVMSRQTLSHSNHEIPSRRPMSLESSQKFPITPVWVVCSKGNRHLLPTAAITNRIHIRRMCFSKTVRRPKLHMDPKITAKPYKLFSEGTGNRSLESRALVFSSHTFVTSNSSVNSSSLSCQSVAVATTKYCRYSGATTLS